MENEVRCSSCGGSKDLYFVTCGEPGGELPGRALVYCADCRRERHHLIDVSLPLSQITEEILLNLYKLGKTASHPDTAVNIVFGKGNEQLARAADEVLRSKRP